MSAAAQTLPTTNTGHEFDFLFGNWRVEHRQLVKRRSIGTPYRRPKGTPLAQRYAVARRRSV